MAVWCVASGIALAGWLVFLGVPVSVSRFPCSGFRAPSERATRSRANPPDVQGYLAHTKLPPRRTLL